VPEGDPGTYPGCYVCGADNPAGFKIRFAKDGEGRCRATYPALPQHNGWPGVIHGGVLFTLMDEAVAWACRFAGWRCVTAKAEARFRAPARVGMTLVIRGELGFIGRRAIRARAEIRDGSDTGPVLTEFEAMMAVVGPIEGQGGTDGQPS
jgi:uncharacterized protein (TIGR00369 family)